MKSKIRKITLMVIQILVPALLFAQNTNSTLDEYKIINEEINPIIYTDKDFKQPVAEIPDWQALYNSVSKKHNDVDAGKLITGAKIRFFSISKRWEEFADAYLTNLEKYDKVKAMESHLKLVGSVNNVLYDKIFKNVTDKKLLKRAAKQAGLILENPHSPRPGKSKELELSNSIDTYANLLYKAGKTRQAIKWQKKAVEYTNGANRDFVTNLKKMENGTATW